MILEANAQVPQVIFYIAKDVDELFDSFMEELGPNFAFAVGNEKVATVSMGYGCEVTFLTEVDSPDLLMLPKSNHIYLEKSETADEIKNLLQEHTEKFTLVDPKTKEAL